MGYGGARRTVRQLLLGSLAAALTFAAAACGTTDESAGGGGASITVEHKHGSTEITGTPQRIVALGNQWLDTALSLGISPVGYIDNVAVVSGTASPWQPQGALGDAKQLNAAGNVAEQVAALEPDLILADPFIADAQKYQEFSRIAPTLPALDDKLATPWRDMVATLGKVVHRETAAADVVAALDAKITGIVTANPGLRGKTFASTWLGSPSQLFVLNDPKDGSAEVFTQLGLTIPANLLELKASPGGRAVLSTEKVDELTADLLLAGYSPGFDEKYRQLPGYDALPSVRKNSVAFLTNQEITVVNQPTVLSIPHILDKIMPAIVNAAA